MISCILLTAGESQRFGSPKAVAQIGSMKAIELLQEHLIKSVVDEIIIVTGANESLIKPYVFNHSKVRLVYNKDYKFGQTSSFQTGLSIVDKNTEGFMLLPVDCPFVLTSTMDTLIRFFEPNNAGILIPTYQGQRGHPPIFSSKSKKEIVSLPTEQGLNRLTSKYAPQLLEINDPGIVKTFNTPQELDHILSQKSRDD
jgi:CTP:molybdopterin cytidylyltransferase MocA